MDKILKDIEPLQNTDIKTNTFNKKSLILILNYFITPFFIILVLIKFLINKNVIDNVNTFSSFLKSILGTLATFISFIIAIFLIKNRNDSISIKKSEFSIKKLILIGFSLGIFMIFWNFVMIYVYPIFGFVFKSNNTENIVNSLKSNKLLFINLLISAPIGEEIAFKYGIFTFFHEFFQNKGVFLKTILPAFISSFIFAIIHDGLFLVPMYIVPSFIGCLIYKKTRSLLPCVLGHFLNNFLSVILILLT